MLASSQMDADDAMPGLEDAASERRENLRADVAVMKELRCTRWGDIELHESAFSHPDAGEKDTTQPRLSPEEEERRAREQRRSIAMRSSGGQIPRLSDRR